MSTSTISFYKFLYEPELLAKETKSQQKMKALTILFGIVTVGLVHLLTYPFYRHYLKNKHIKNLVLDTPQTKKPADVANSILLPTPIKTNDKTPIDQKLIEEEDSWTIDMNNPAHQKLIEELTGTICLIKPHHESKDGDYSITFINAFVSKMTIYPDSTESKTQEILIKKSKSQDHYHVMFLLEREGVITTTLKSKETFTKAQISAMFRFQLTPPLGYRALSNDEFARAFFIFPCFPLFFNETENSSCYINQQGSLEVLGKKS